MTESKGDERQCSYQSRIRGNRLSVYRLYFPLSEILSPPAGWIFQRVSQWRRGCQDECWRAVYVRAAPK